MQTVYIGNTLINDIFLGNKRMDDAIQPPAAYTIEYLLVAAGGSGIKGTDSFVRNGGGGGGGGLISGSLTLLPSTNYPIVVGAARLTYGDNGNDSTAFSLTAVGGGGGARLTGASGGSGGGGGTGAGGGATSGQGNSGGAGGSNTGGGGGGAASAGAAGGASGGAKGGNGLPSLISGTQIYYSAGGSGGGSNGYPTNVTEGGTGYGSPGSGGYGYSGGQQGTAAYGFDGICIIRYLGPQRGTGGTVTTDGAYTIHTFNAGSTTYYSN